MYYGCFQPAPHVIMVPFLQLGAGSDGTAVTAAARSHMHVTLRSPLVLKLWYGVVVAAAGRLWMQTHRRP
jgi:hypothetical protein